MIGVGTKNRPMRLAILMGFSFALRFSNPSFSAESRPVYGGSLVIANDKNFQGLDPLSINIRRANNYALFDMIVEGLLGVDRQGNLIPSLAESWEVSKDGTLYTFRLRRGVKFHNGSELTSEDVKWTFERMLDPKTRNPQRPVLSILKSVEPKSSYEVLFHLGRPFVPFLEKLTSNYAPILPKDTLPGIASHPMGTGPFVFVSAPTGQEVRLQRFKDYWQKGLPYLDEVIFKPIPDETTRLVALRTGDAHLATYLPVEPVDRLMKEKNPAVRFFFQQAGLSWILFNNTQPPFNNKLARQALAYAIDKKEILEAVALGYGQVSNQRYPKGHKWWVNVPDRPQDPAKARALLREAGYGTGLRLDVPTHQGDIRVTTLLQSHLRKVGVEINIQLMDYAQYVKTVDKHTYGLVTGGGGIYVDPDGFYKRRFHSEENWDLGYNNADVDRLLNEAQVMQNEKTRREIYRKVIEIIQDEVPAIFIGLTPVVTGSRTALQGFEPNFFGDTFNYTTGGVSRAWIEQ